jgi:hypothetical protein
VVTYSLCLAPGNESLVLFDARAGTVVQSIPMPPGTGCTGNLALDSAQAVVYCLDPTGELLSVGLNSGRVVNGSALGIGHVQPWGPIWCDNRTGAVFLSDARNRSLEVLSPLTGHVTARIPFPSGVVAIQGDTSTDRLYVSYGYPNGNSSVLNLSTLATIATAGVYSSDSIVLDPAHTEVYFVGYGGVGTIRADTDAVVTGPLVQIYGQGPVAYDPIHDQFVALVTGIELYFVYTPVQHTVTSPAPFSATPVLGAWTPAVVGAAATAVGVAFLARWALQERRARALEGDAWLANTRTR